MELVVVVVSGNLFTQCQAFVRVMNTLNRGAITSV